jgi:hypothetical protein
MISVTQSVRMGEYNQVIDPGRVREFGKVGVMIGYCICD